MPTQPTDVSKDEIVFSGAISPQEQLDQSFARLLAYIQGKIARYHPYYRRLFRQQGIDPMAIRSYEDFRKIPLTRKEAIVENQADFTLWPRYPGANQTHDADEIDAASMERYRQAAMQPGFKDIFRSRPLQERVHEQFLLDWRPIHFQMSGGTTGKAIVTGYSQGVSF